MAEIVAVKEACGTTVNEVVLTVLSIALRRYAEMHNLDTKGRKLRLVIPVNVRPAGTQVRQEIRSPFFRWTSRGGFVSLRHFSRLCRSGLSSPKPPTALN